MIVKQFFDEYHRQYRYLFCMMTATSSRTIYSPNLFGGLDESKHYTSGFKLELVYG